MTISIKITEYEEIRKVLEMTKVSDEGGNVTRVTGTAGKGVERWKRWK